jgi:hypothetical protein
VIGEEVIDQVQYIAFYNSPTSVKHAPLFLLLNPTMHLSGLLSLSLVLLASKKRSILFATTNKTSLCQVEGDATFCSFSGTALPDPEEIDLCTF